jgi:hypothetical protein
MHFLKKRKSLLSRKVPKNCSFHEHFHNLQKQRKHCFTDNKNCYKGHFYLDINYMLMKHKA